MSNSNQSAEVGAVATVVAEKKPAEQVTFKVREDYVNPTEDGIMYREFDVTGTTYEDSMGNTRYDLTRSDTGAKVYPFMLCGVYELISDVEFIAVSGFGGWGRGADVETALKNMMDATGISKSKAKQLETLRTIRVFSGVKGTMYVDGWGGVGGLMLKPVKDWLITLYDMLKPKKK